MKQRNLILSVLAAVLFSSCIRDRIDKLHNSAGEGLPAIISFSAMMNGTEGTTRAGYHDPGELTPGGGYAVGREEDSNISHLRILVYNSRTGALTENLSFDLKNKVPRFPVEAEVLTGTYDFYFITNADESSLGTTLADDDLVSSVTKLAALAFDDGDYAADKDIPMFERVSGVQVVGDNHLIHPVEGEIINSEWEQTITRTGIRLSFEITLSPNQYESWTSKEIEISGIPATNYIFPDNDNQATPGGTLTFAASETEGDEAGFIEPLRADPSDPASGIIAYRIRYDRVILPELLFADEDNGDKAMELSMNVMNVEKKAKIRVDNDTEDYTLPRNTWLHLDVTVEDAQLLIYPTVLVWNGALLEDVLFDGEYFLRVDRSLLSYLKEGGGETFRVTTNYPGGFTVEEAITDLTLDATGGAANPDGVPVEATLGANPGSTARTVGTFTVKAGERMRKTITVYQMGTVDGTLPPGVTPYVGAFWKASQTGERLIRIPRPTTAPTALDGPWTASVVHGKEWIVLDKMMTGDVNVGWRTDVTPVEASVRKGNDPGFDRDHRVNGTATYVGGEVDENTPDGIYFRIGLTDAIPAGEHRYGMVLLTYTNDGQTKQQRIWVRQGEEADYLLRPGDPYTGTPTDRSLARKFSPYNLTAREFKGAGVSTDPGNATNAWVDVRPWKQASKAVFTDYPSQAGAFFRWAHTEGVRAYNPTGSPSVPANWDWDIPNSVTVAWGADDPLYALHGDAAAVTTIGQNYESCPENYRRPQEGSLMEVDQSTISLSLSEAQQSLLVNGIDGGSGTPSWTPQNSIWGYYADGFFDRMAIGEEIAVDSNHGENVAVSTGNSTVAYIGMLLYNPTTHGSIFFPAAGTRYGGTYEYEAGLSATGLTGQYWTSGSVNSAVAWRFRVERSGADRYQLSRQSGMLIRCVKAPVAEY